MEGLPKLWKATVLGSWWIVDVVLAVCVLCFVDRTIQRWKQGLKANVPPMVRVVALRRFSKTMEKPCLLVRTVWHKK